MLELFHIKGRPFSEHFDAPVIEVLHVTDNLMPGRRALREETIPHTLHVATDEKLPSNRKHVHGIEFNTEPDFAQCADRETSETFFNFQPYVASMLSGVRDSIVAVTDVRFGCGLGIYYSSRLLNSSSRGYWK